MAKNFVSCAQYIGYARRKAYSTDKKRIIPVGKIIAFIILTLFVLMWMTPFLLLVAGALRTSADGNAYPEVLFGTRDGPTWDNFYMLLTGKINDKFVGQIPTLKEFKIWTWLGNTCIAAIGGTALYLLVASLAAYAFTFIDFKYRDVIFAVLVMTMVVPGAATSVANQNTVFSTGLNKSLLALIIPGLGGIYGMYLIRTFFTSIPHELIESAKMDGYSNIKIFYKIVLPLGKTVILVQGLFGFMGGWNDLVWPQMLYGSVKNIDLWTLQVGMAYVAKAYSGNNSIGIACASGIICILPVLVVYLFAQKYIIEGMSSAGIKK